MSTAQPIPEVRIRYGVKGGLGVSELIVEVGQSWRTAATARYPWIWDPANLSMRIMMILIMMATIYDDQENFWHCNSKFEGICVKKNMIYPSLALLLLYSWCLFVLDTRPQQTLDYESKLCQRICWLFILRKSFLLFVYISMSCRTKESFAARSFICSDSCFQRSCEGRRLWKKGTH